MSVLWYLEYDGLKRTLAEWGIEKPRLKFISQSADELSFDVTEQLIAEPLFLYGKSVVLWRGGTRWFTGTIVQRPADGTAQSERQSYLALGPWWYLEQISFQQDRWFLSDLTDSSAGRFLSASTRVVLQQGSDGLKVTVGNQIGQIISYAIGRKAPLTLASLPVPPHGLETFAPYDKAVDLNCAEALMRCLRWTRDVVTWFDYSSAVPVLHIDRRPNLASSSIDLNGGGLVTSLSRITSREDLQPRGVLFKYISIKQDAKGNQWTYPTDDTAGLVDGGIGNVIITMELSGVGPSAEEPPVGLAAQFYSSLSTLQWQGTVTLNESNPSGAWRPGKVINLLGGRSPWATMNALIQVVEEDLTTGETSVEFGPASQLGPQDYLELIRFRRDFDAGNDPSSRFEGTPSKPQPPKDPERPPPGPPTGDPENEGQTGFLELETCLDGSPVTVVVSGYIKRDTLLS